VEESVGVKLMRVDVSMSKDIVLVVGGVDRRFHLDVSSNLFLDRGFIEASLDEVKPRVFYVGGVGMLGGD